PLPRQRFRPVVRRALARDAPPTDPPGELPKEAHHCVPGPFGHSPIAQISRPPCYSQPPAPPSYDASHASHHTQIPHYPRTARRHAAHSREPARAPRPPSRERLPSTL